MDALLLALLVTVGTLLAGLALVVGAVVALASTLPPVSKGVVAFFHPFADGGGGGERVLWCAVQAVQEAAPHAQIAIYVHAGVSAAELVADARQRFGIEVTAPLQVVPLRRTHLVAPERYRRLTLARQAGGSVLLGLEALRQLVPEVYIDTTGWAFPYPLARRAGAVVVAYVHYPTISSDMAARVAAGAAAFNNDADIAESPLKSAAKLAYYAAMAAWYGASGAAAHVALANSSWTRDHVRRLWWLARRPPLLVYPPVDVASLASLPLDRKLKSLYLLAVAQFRPEKNQRLLLEAFAAAKRAAGPNLQGQAVREARLKLVGSCRHADDEARLAALQAAAAELGVADCVDWVVNAPFPELRALLGGAVGGLHAMVDEHFGIVVVEYMAAGVVPIAHASAGPKQDIVVPHVGAEEGAEQAVGFLAATVEEYADAITRVLSMDQRERLRMAAAAQAAAARFSADRFRDAFAAAVADVLPPPPPPPAAAAAR